MMPITTVVVPPTLTQSDSRGEPALGTVSRYFDPQGFPVQHAHSPPLRPPLRSGRSRRTTLYPGNIRKLSSTSELSHVSLNPKMSSLLSSSARMTSSIDGSSDLAFTCPIRSGGRPVLAGRSPALSPLVRSAAAPGVRLAGTRSGYASARDASGTGVTGRWQTSLSARCRRCWCRRPARRPRRLLFRVGSSARSPTIAPLDQGLRPGLTSHSGRRAAEQAL